MFRFVFITIFFLSVSIHAIPQQRVSSNLLALMFLGDLNIAYEHKFKPDAAWVSTFHLGPEHDTFFNASSPTMRFTLGYRFFNLKQKNTVAFIEVKLGSVSDFNDIKLIKFKTTHVLFEVYGGEQFDFNDTLYYEYKFGAIRNLSSGSMAQFYPAFGLNLGIYL